MGQEQEQVYPEILRELNKVNRGDLVRVLYHSPSASEVRSAIGYGEVFDYGRFNIELILFPEITFHKKLGLGLLKGRVSELDLGFCPYSNLEGALNPNLLKIEVLKKAEETRKDLEALSRQ